MNTLIRQIQRRSLIKLGWIVFGFLVGHPMSAQIEVISGGNVGIGTNSPSAKLEIDGDGSDSQDLLRIVRGGGNAARLQLGHAYIQRYDDTGAASNLYLNLNGGNVGIGTSSPGAKLEVAGSVNIGAAMAQSFAETLNLNFNDTAHNYMGFISDGATNGTGIVTNWMTGNSYLDFRLGGTTTTYTKVRIDSSGNVGIGTTSPSYPLHVNGSVRATSFISNSTTYPDFVFKPGYKLAPLSEVEAQIAEKGHLAGVPSEAEAKKEGIDLAAMQVKLLQKVEELTLYVIELKKENIEQQRQIERLSGD